jgi:hypothetical protein
MSFRPEKSEYALPVAASDAYPVVDFVAVLLGYAISGERTLETFYERLQPFANAFMALLGRDREPSRSTSPAFLPPWINLLSRLCAPCFSKTWEPDLWRRRSKEEDWGIGGELATWSSILMARDKPPANALCPAHLICPPQRAGCRKCALLAIAGASGVK